MIPNPPEGTEVPKGLMQALSTIDAAVLLGDHFKDPDMANYMQGLLHTWERGLPEEHLDTVSIRWCVEDIESNDPEICKHLTEEQKRDIVQSLHRRHDASVGVNWEVISAHVEYAAMDICADYVRPDLVGRDDDHYRIDLLSGLLDLDRMETSLYPVGTVIIAAEEYPQEAVDRAVGTEAHCLVKDLLDGRQMGLLQLEPDRPIRVRPHDR